jgi:hypothetical protein
VGDSADAREQVKFPSRATKSISLVLIGSSLLLAGCGGSPSTRCQDDPNLPKDQQKNCSGSTRHYTGSGGSRVYVGSGRGGGGAVGRTSVGGTTRGGFGAVGHAAAGG